MYVACRSVAGVQEPTFLILAAEIEGLQRHTDAARAQLRLAPFGGAA
jgi:hypothetical protein